MLQTQYSVVCRSVTTVISAKTAEPIRTRVGPGHVRRSMYWKRLSRGQNRYGADAGWGVLDEGAHCRNLANTTEPSVCGGDAALRQIALTTCYSAVCSMSFRQRR